MFSLKDKVKGKGEPFSKTKTSFTEYASNAKIFYSFGDCIEIKAFFDSEL